MKIKKHLGIIDIEPSWVSLIPVLMDMQDRELAESELMKIAKIADTVRQAQKNKEKLVFDFTKTK